MILIYEKNQSSQKVNNSDVYKKAHNLFHFGDYSSAIKFATLSLQDIPENKKYEINSFVVHSLLSLGEFDFSQKEIIKLKNNKTNERYLELDAHLLKMEGILLFNKKQWISAEKLFIKSLNIMKSVIIIPSRWKSSRFAGKSLALIDGVPMIQRVYERAIKSKEADDVIVATDDKRIFNFCKKNKLKVIITSKNAKNGAERISFATRKIDSKIFVNVQGDCPLINPKSIDKVIFCLKNNISKGYHVSAGCATDNNLKQDKRNSNNVSRVTHLLV